MKTYTVQLYQRSDFESWNAFIEKAKNATFLFHRNFMEYHSDRFEDFSLIVKSNEKWLAVLPANKLHSKVFSHQGLSYGGLVYDEKLKLSAVIAIFKTVLMFLEQNFISTLQLKMLPNHYAYFPSQELSYALFLAEAKLIQRETAAVIDLRKKLSISKSRLEGVNKGIKANLVVKEVFEFSLFWNEILIPNLKENHNAEPVHKLDEMSYLSINFPKNIRQFNVYMDDAIVAGATIFETKTVAHAQYISGNAEKGKLGSVDFLFHHLITAVFKEKVYFDFGTSNHDCGKKLNEGLSFWKESFGANISVQDLYELKTVNHRLL